MFQVSCPSRHRLHLRRKVGVQPLPSARACRDPARVKLPREAKNYFLQSVHFLMWCGLEEMLSCAEQHTRRLECLVQRLPGRVATRFWLMPIHGMVRRELDGLRGCLRSGRNVVAARVELSHGECEQRKERDRDGRVLVRSPCSFPAGGGGSSNACMHATRRKVTWKTAGGYCGRYFRVEN